MKKYNRAPSANVKLPVVSSLIYRESAIILRNAHGLQSNSRYPAASLTVDDQEDRGKRYDIRGILLFRIRNLRRCHVEKEFPCASVLIEGHDLDNTCQLLLQSPTIGF